MPIDLEKLKGLSASDRTPEEKQEISNIMNTSTDSKSSIPDNLTSIDSIGAQIDSSKPLGADPEQLYQKVYESRQAAELDKKLKADYEVALQDYTNQDWGRYSGSIRDDVNDTFVDATPINAIKEIADQISPYYKKYKNSDYLDFTPTEWEDLAKRYMVTAQTYGEQNANELLMQEIQDRVSYNQPILEKVGNAFRGGGANLVGGVLSTLGNIYGIIDAGVSIATGGKHSEYVWNNKLGAFGNVLNSMIDNSWTQYGSDMMQYGSWRPDVIARSKELGLSDTEIVQTYGQQQGTDSFANQIFNLNTIPIALQSGGFTLMSMMTGAAEAKMANILFKNIKAAKVAKALKTGNKELLAKQLTRIQKAETFTDKFIIPGLVGNQEAAINALDTKQSVEEDGYRYAQEMFQQKVADAANAILAQKLALRDNTSTAEKSISDQLNQALYKGKSDLELMEDSYNEAWQKLESEYRDYLEQVNFAAGKSAVHKFFIDSFINGLANTTLKAGLEAPSVQKALRNGKLTGWAFKPTEPKVTITGTGADTKVDVKIPTFGKIYGYAKEPIGEFGEEYFQDVSDATVQGSAMNNIHVFIDRKYNGDDAVEVGDRFASDITAGWTGFTNSLMDLNSVKSGVYGAVSSVLGTPGMPHRVGTGKYVKGADGQLREQKTFFGRGVNANGEKESVWEWGSRITPWRSGLTANIHEAQDRKHLAENNAKYLQEWLRDPANAGKFDGLVGTYGWSKLMDSSAALNDEFGYRNSELGKTINDAFMLEKFKGTDFYESYMNQLIQSANLEEDSDEAKAAVKAFRDNVNNDEKSESMTDKEIITALKKNANRMLTALDKIYQESEKLDQLLGNVDEDTKQALIFGQLSQEDWTGRSKKLDEEIGAIRIPDSKEASINLTTEQKGVIARYGSLKSAKEEQAKFDKQKESLTEDIKNLEDRKESLTDTEKKTLKEKKAKLKFINSQLTKLASIDSIEKEEDIVLNESQIMALDPISRAIMLKKGKQKLQKTLEGEGENQTEVEKPYFSDAQQIVIDNLINEGIAQDRDFFDKVVDRGKIESARKTFLSQYTAILSDPNSFNDYVFAAKQRAADVLTKKKFETISAIEDYVAFANEMDKLDMGSAPRERQMITQALKNSGNENYTKYLTQKETLNNLVLQLQKDDKFKDLNKADIDMFTASLSYLSNLGIDLNNENDVVNALIAKDENDKFKFKTYVDELNANVPEESQIWFTSIVEATQTYKDVMFSLKKDQAEIAANNTPVEVAPTTPEQAAPAPQVVAEVAPSPETPTSESQPQSVPINPTPQTPSGGTSTVASIETPITFRGVAQNIINNTQSTSDEVKEATSSILDELSIDDSASATDYAHALMIKSVELDSDDTDNSDLNSQIANILRRIASSISLTASEQAEQAITGQDQSQQDQKPSDSLLSRFHNRPRISKEGTDLTSYGSQQLEDRTNPNAAQIDGLNMETMKMKHKNSPIVQFFEQYKIAEYLSSGKITNKTPVMFVVDPTLESATISSMGQRYSDSDRSIVAVVEDPNGPYEIGGKKYQPIAVMPASQNSNINGAYRMYYIREAAKGQSAGNLLVDNNGKVITTTINGTVHAYPPTRIPEGSPNKPVLSLTNEQLTSQERTELEHLNPIQKRASLAYQRVKSAFLKKIRPDSRKQVPFVLSLSNLKGDDIEFQVLVTPVQNTKVNGKTIGDLFNSEDQSALEFNSRVEGFIKALDKFLDNLKNDKDIIFDINSNGTPIFLGKSDAKISAIVKQFADDARKHLSLPNGWEFKLRPINTTTGIAYNLYITDNAGQSISISEFSVNTPIDKYTATKNLFMDGNQIRMIDQKNSFIKWQVPQPSVDATTGNIYKNDMAQISSAYDDGILEMSIESLNYTITGVTINSPFNNEGLPLYDNQQSSSVVVSNPDNASTPGITQPVTPQAGPQVVTPNGAVVDSDTGAVVSGKAAQPSRRTTEKTPSAKPMLDINGKPIIIYRGYALTEDTQATDLDETVAGTASDYIDDFDAGYHFTSSKETAQDYANTRTDKSDETFVNIDGQTVTQRNRHYIGDYGRVSAFTISEDAKIVTFKDLHDYNLHKDRAKGADIIKLETDTLGQPNPEYIVTKKAKNMIQFFTEDNSNQASKTQTVQVDEYTGMTVDNEDKPTRRRSGKPTAKPRTGENRVEAQNRKSDRLTWGKFEGYTNDDGQTLDVESTMVNLLKFYTKEEWDKMDEKECKHELNCKGVFN